MTKLEKKLKKKCSEVKSVTKVRHAKKVSRSTDIIATTHDNLDLTEDMINMFIRFEV